MSNNFVGGALKLKLPGGMAPPQMASRVPMVSKSKDIKKSKKDKKDKKSKKKDKKKHKDKHSKAQKSDDSGCEEIRKEEVE